MQGENDGFAGQPFIAAGADFQKLTQLEPFQPGFLGTTYETASGRFGDGKGAMHLMGDWGYLAMRGRSQCGEGLPDDQLAILSFPMIADPVTEGEDKATLGGINGWAVTSDAAPGTMDFLTFMLNREHQEEMARENIFIPIAKGAVEALEHPFFRQVARDIAGSSYHQIFLHQFLGASDGARVNDISADLAQGVITPEEAAEQVREA